MRQRIIELTLIHPENILFETEEEQNNFFSALGRQVCWNLLHQDAPDNSFTTVTIDGKLEIIACHYKTFSQQSLDHAITQMRGLINIHPIENPFVIGAIRDDKGQYSFHS